MACRIIAPRAAQRWIQSEESLRRHHSKAPAAPTRTVLTCLADTGQHVVLNGGAGLGADSAKDEPAFHVIVRSCILILLRPPLLEVGHSPTTTAYGSDQLLCCQKKQAPYKSDMHLLGGVTVNFE